MSKRAPAWPPERKGGCQPKADRRVVSTLLIFMVAPGRPAWVVCFIRSPEPEMTNPRRKAPAGIFVLTFLFYPDFAAL